MPTHTTTEPESGSSAASTPVARHRLMIWTTHFLGVPVVADALGIEERSVRAKVNGDRGTSDNDLQLCLAALDQRVTAIAAHAAAIRRALTLPSPERTQP